MRRSRGEIFKFVTHSRKVLKIAKRFGWLPGARYTNLRDIKTFDTVGFIDIDWERYDFRKHIDAVKTVNPLMTVARDIEREKDLLAIIDEAIELALWASYIIIVPKTPTVMPALRELDYKRFILGYSVPSKYGRTPVAPEAFCGPVHLLGGRPDKQKGLSESLRVFSIDCNRFTLDAAFGDYFDGEIFRPHPKGGYENCITDSIRNINGLWASYSTKEGPGIGS